ncbi:MAG: SMI1/KNR4 family protein [Verrucomicrobiales bacterium]|nr:SMI1/KNR4 family protein [Verrucomicrobiales bacterium]
MSSIDKLIEIGSKALTNESPQSTQLLSEKSELSKSLKDLLEGKNGFVAFEAALVVFPSCDIGQTKGIESWNLQSGWRNGYADCLDPETIFFAHDLFGVQFGIEGDRVVQFNPETGELTTYANSFDEWASVLLENYQADTGWPLAHEWQIANGQLLPHERLLPKQPFILGGEFEVDNLIAIEAECGMRNWATLYNSIKTASDGEEVSVSGWLDCR